MRVIPLSTIDDAPDHPFGVRDDEEMAELMESISTFGVINPVIVRRTGDERYEMISGHRRKYACLKLGIDTLPVIVRDLSREEAIIYMVDSNLQREHILPSERAKAYKMKMEALKSKEQEEAGMFGFHKKKRIVRIPVTEYEYYIIIDSLLKYRDKLIAQGKYTDGVDETILAVSK